MTIVVLAGLGLIAFISYITLLIIKSFFIFALAALTLFPTLTISVQICIIIMLCLIPITLLITKYLKIKQTLVKQISK